MALLRELFSPKRKVPSESESRDSGARSYKITKEQVRLLLFKECDWRGRKLLFDSSTIEKVPIDKNAKSFTKLACGEEPCVVEVSDGFAYQYKGPAADASTLGEMMFGAVAMNYKGVSLKIHILEEPHRLMCTKVFGVPALARARGRPVDAMSDATSDATGEATAHLGVPTFSLEEGLALSFSFDRADSGFYGDNSPNSSVSSTRDYCAMFERMWDSDDACGFRVASRRESSGCSGGSRRESSGCSGGSWQRRALRSLATRFELRSGNLLAVPSNAESQVFSGCSSSATCDSGFGGGSAAASEAGGGAARRRTKLGLALLITLADHQHKEMLRYCSEHSPQLEALICRLRMAVMLSGVQRADGPGFVATLVRATADAVRWLMELLNGPRLRSAWLELARAPTPRTARHALADSLLADVCSLLRAADTKQTNFFISTLLTHVLTYHLGWVSTVSPYEASPADADPRAPYNALWAQLNDLCGAIGSPQRAARTIVAGKDRQFVNKLLTVLTYFIRCGQVSRNVYSGDDFSYGPLTDYSVTSVPVVGSPTRSSVATGCANSLRKISTRCRLADLADSSECGSKVLTGCDSSLKRVSTTALLPEVLSIGKRSVGEFNDGVLTNNERNASASEAPMTSRLKRTSTVMRSLLTPNTSELSDGSDDAKEPKGVVFVLGDDEKLIGLKNKSSGGKSVKKSSKCLSSDVPAVETSAEREQICDSSDESGRSSVSPSRCCGQQSQHSKPIKHSGFKFEFDKYPQIVTNYMKSKNLEILDRHYIGKPGNLKLDNFQFDPTVVPPIQEERCENCDKCRMIESTLQTPTNASELWSDVANESPAPQYAREEIVEDEVAEGICSQPPKKFVRKRKKNTVVVNLPDPITMGIGERVEEDARGSSFRADPPTKHLRVIDVGMPRCLESRVEPEDTTGFHSSLLGGLTDHYVPDMILQGTIAAPGEWETEVRRDLDLTTHINKSYDNPLQAVAIVADSDQWAVKVLSSGGGGACAAGGMSALVGSILDALPHMERARMPAHQCLSFVEWKLRELCVLSKTLADMLMSCTPCDMATLTAALRVDADDVPLLLAVASTHTPHLARRYGVNRYR